MKNDCSVFTIRTGSSAKQANKQTCADKRDEQAEKICPEFDCALRELSALAIVARMQTILCNCDIQFIVYAHNVPTFYCR